MLPPRRALARHGGGDRELMKEPRVAPVRRGHERTREPPVSAVPGTRRDDRRPGPPGLSAARLVPARRARATCSSLRARARRRLLPRAPSIVRPPLRGPVHPGLVALGPAEAGRAAAASSRRSAPGADHFRSAASRANVRPIRWRCLRVKMPLVTTASSNFCARRQLMAVVTGASFRSPSSSPLPMPASMPPPVRPRCRLPAVMAPPMSPPVMVPPSMAPACAAGAPMPMGDAAPAMQMQMPRRLNGRRRCRCRLQTPSRPRRCRFTLPMVPPHPSMMRALRATPATTGGPVTYQVDTPTRPRVSAR